MTAAPWTASLRVRPLRLLAMLCLGLTAATSAAAQVTPAPAANPSTAVLQPGDKVRLKVWREPDLSGEFEVAVDGAVIFPMIGRVMVARLSTDSLRNFLTALYSSALRSPSIEVTALRRVNVVGAVRSPGFYYVDPTVTVTGALALAGGITAEASRHSIDLVRDGKRIQMPLANRSVVTDLPLLSGDQVNVPERGWLSRNAALVISAVTAAAFLATAIHWN